jgi:hypothetical protein
MFSDADGRSQGIRTRDLLDANETISAFIASSCVGSATNPQLTVLTSLTVESCRKYCCVPAAYSADLACVLSVGLPSVRVDRLD